MTAREAKVIVAIFSAVCITCLELYALSQDVNGLALTTVVGALAGLGGWFVRGWRSK